MKRSISLLSMILMAALITGPGAMAQQTATAPVVISYQGMLTSIDGKPVLDGEYQITVTFYDDEHGTNRVWQDTYQTMVQGGVFSLYLGSGKVPLPAPGQMDRALWVGTRISDNHETRPLTRLSATPYALNVADRAITTSKLADGAVTKEKVNMKYVEGVSINGTLVEGKGTTLNIQAGKDIDVRYDEKTQSVVIGTATSGKGSTEDKKGDRELQGTALDAWTMRGEGISVLSGNSVPATAGDYIGTNAPGNVSFNIKVNGQPAMTYQPNGSTTPSIIGGNGSNGAPGNGQGNTISGGGSGTPVTANSIQGLLYNSIGGGEGNKIQHANSDYGTIGGGGINSIGSPTIGVDNGTIGGGIRNRVLETAGTIGGGQSNIVNLGGLSGTIAGGSSNNVNAVFGTIGGGMGNEINGSNGAITGGESNSANGYWDAIGGGIKNWVNGPASGIFSGESNYVEQDHSAIGGGANNMIVGRTSFIGGGNNNRIEKTSNAVIAGGADNQIFLGASSGILSGSSNYIESGNSAIATGIGNRIAGEFSFIGAGDNNYTENYYNIIGSGRGNQINGTFNFIGNGVFNTISTELSAIATGADNHISSGHSFIGSGRRNQINGLFSFIGSGAGNSAEADYTVIGGGIGNINQSIYATIGGGIGNRATNSAPAGTIPGGDNLLVQSYGQTAVGVWNAPRGNVPFRFGGQLRTNDPIFMVGNGFAPGRSNAFEVSYNGHSTVYHTNGQGTPAIIGATYTDNITYAWGDIGWNGATIVRNSDFGVLSITRQGAGWYRVKMTLTTPTDVPTNLNAASVTASISTNAAPGGMFAKCRYITVSRINAANEFDVFITEQRINAGTMMLDCVNVDDSFMFKVTGRP